MDTVLSTQQEYKLDLIVMGTDGSDEEEEQASSRTARLVLVIPAKVSDFQMKQIALALDQNDIDNEYSLGVVHDFARWFGAKIHLLTIRSETSLPRKKNYETESMLEYYLETLDYRLNVRIIDTQAWHNLFCYPTRKTCSPCTVVPTGAPTATPPSSSACRAPVRPPSRPTPNGN